jgi:hypothetical protein
MADTVPVLADAEMVDASEIARASPQVNAEAVAPLPVVEAPIQSSSDPSANTPERVTWINPTGTFLKALLMICRRSHGSESICSRLASDHLIRKLVRSSLMLYRLRFVLK